MLIRRIAFDQVPQFSFKDVAYATSAPFLRPFYKYPVEISSFQKVIEDKKKDNTNRQVLVDVLKEQYKDLDTSKSVKKNIESLLSDKTYTVITAHQPALFTGPLYYILKIFSTINLAERLKESYPDYHFVPVFVNGSEDHDFDEINHTLLNGKTLVWNNNEGGSVGKMSTSSLKQALKDLKNTLGDSHWAGYCYQIIEEAYTQNKTYGKATNHLVNTLFKDYGVVVLEMSDRKLKQLFVPYMEKEIFEQVSSALVQDTQQKLESAGFSQQAHARDINVFYLRPNDRSRLVREEDGSFRVLDSELNFTKESLRQELHRHPERFSPNVVMRPLYQELILPNLAYIGGGGELAYWLERQSQFDYFGLNFPMLIRRNSAVWIPKKLVRKIKKLGLDILELFEETESLIKKYVSNHSKNELSLDSEMKELEALIDKYAMKAQKVDPTLYAPVRAIGQKYHNQLEKLEKRLMRTEKKKYEDDIATIRLIKDELFPKNGLQERKHNFMNFYAQDGPFFFKTLKENLDPLEEGMVVFIDD